MLPEAVRNRVLRRADWRFLLPDAYPARTLCLAGGRLGKGTELISGETIGERAAPASCDLAVIVDPDHRSLRAGWSALAPGGSLYTEWNLHPSLTPAALRRRLQRIGFADVDCYWPWPPLWSRPTRAWVPVEQPGVVTYFFKRHLRQDGIGRVPRSVLHLLFQLARTTGMLRPLCVIARKPPAVDKPPWATTKTDAACLLLTGGPRSISKVVALVFSKGEAQPSLAVKCARVSEAIPRLRREARGLSAAVLETSAPAGMPRVVFQREGRDQLALGETAVVGTPMYRLINRRTYRDLAIRGTDWLARLATGREASPTASWWERLVGSVIRRFETEFGAVVDPGALAVARELLGRLGPLPVVLEQRDFAPWNLMITRNGELGVLDWESSEPSGLPVLDLVYFFTYLTFELDHVQGPSRHFRESYRASLDAETFTGRVRSECFDRYLTITDLDPAVVEPLRLLTWMVHAHSDYEHLLADHAGQPPASALTQGLFVSLWQMEIESITGQRANTGPEIA